MEITVVTNVELGWDCVVAVYGSEVSQDWLETEYPDDDGYVLHTKKVVTSQESNRD
ncbi:hypothetical protein RsoM2USA_51 [Ralstonia phage RsoM2USA]|nr:hypothetical protein RsoM2USA_51 [Ralstonia phage RsoM2USA]